MLLVLFGAAYANSMAGLAVPSVGGGFAGPAEKGALGLVHQPTAAAEGEGFEVVVDVGGVWTRLDVDLDAWPEPTGNPSLVPQPTVLASWPVGRFGFGLVVQGPQVRGGSAELDTPQAYNGIRSNIMLIEGDLTAAYRVTDAVSLGVGARIGHFTYLSDKLLDTGAFLNNALDLEPAFDVGEPLLQGRQTIGPATGVNVSWLVGATLKLPGKVALHAMFRPPWRNRVSGPVALEPSNDLNTVVDGEVDVALTFPAEARLAASIPLGRTFALKPEAAWIGWRRSGSVEAIVRDLTLSSSDPLVNGVLSSAGLDEGGFLDASEGPLDSELRWRNIWTIGAQASFAPRSDLELRAGAWVHPYAVRDDWVSPSNLDFSALLLRGGAAWRVSRPLRVALSVERVLSQPRTITNSPLSLENPPPGGPVTLSGNGRYALALWRAGLTLQFFVLPRES